MSLSRSPFLGRCPIFTIIGGHPATRPLGRVAVAKINRRYHIRNRHIALVFSLRAKAVRTKNLMSPCVLIVEPSLHFYWPDVRTR
jgi:hypothetical protein